MTQIRIHHSAKDWHNKLPSSACFTCGSSKCITRHHIVPKVYVREISKEVRANFDQYNTVALCSKCHNWYEHSANELKNKLLIEYGIVDTIYETEIFQKITRTMKCPDRNIGEDMVPIAIYFGCDLSSQWMETVYKYIEDRRNIHARVARKLKTKEMVIEFINIWRNHFISTMETRSYFSNFPVEAFA